MLKNVHLFENHLWPAPEPLHCLGTNVGFKSAWCIRLETAGEIKMASSVVKDLRRHRYFRTIIIDWVSTLYHMFDCYCTCAARMQYLVSMASQLSGTMTCGRLTVTWLDAIRICISMNMTCALGRYSSCPAFKNFAMFSPAAFFTIGLSLSKPMLFVGGGVAEA